MRFVTAAEPGLLDEPLLTASELSELLGRIPAKTILQYARDGRLLGCASGGTSGSCAATSRRRT
jgi:hypothetical protein